MNILELYSGIGGFHSSLIESQIYYKSVTAIDINTTANIVYSQNFSDSNLINKTIESLHVEDLDVISPDLIWMSPPCQPFARVGKRQDSADRRTASFFYILDILPRLKKLPRYVLLENVKGFDESETREALLATLNSCGYITQEFLLSPLQFGVPNSRLRYYLLAKHKSSTFNFKPTPGIHTKLPPEALPFLDHVTDGDGCREKALQMDTNSATPLYQQCPDICARLADYLDAAVCENNDEYAKQFYIPDKFINRFWVMDIVTADSRNTCCFTKRYAHHIEGAGSVVRTNTSSSVDLEAYKAARVYNPEVEAGVRELGLRFFSPTEIARLLCFPPDFKLPDELSTIQCYRVLGNSLNVHVVSVLLRLITLGDDVT